MTTVSVQPTTNEQNEQNEREAFERDFIADLLAKHDCNEGEARIYLKRRNGIYVHHNTNNKWHGWQAAWQHQQKRIDELEADLTVMKIYKQLSKSDKEILAKDAMDFLASRVESLQAQLTIAVDVLEKQQENSNKLRCFLWNNAKSQSAYEKMQALGDLVTDGIAEALAEIKKIGE
jgi:hypothetical protein